MVERKRGAGLRPCTLPGMLSALALSLVLVVCSIIQTETVSGAKTQSTTLTACNYTTTREGAPVAVSVSEPENPVADPADDKATDEAEKQVVTRVKAPAKAKGVYAIDLKTDAVYCTKNSRTARPAASTSKIMTLYLVHEKIANGDGRWTDKITIKDRKLYKLSKNPAYSGSVRLNIGRVVSVRQLYKLSLIESNNAATIQLGRWVSGSDRNFVAAMNAKADEFGMTDSSFVNACGIDNADMTNDLGIPIIGKKSDFNKMSPRDMSILAKNIITDYPSILSVSKRAQVTVKGFKIHQTNVFISGSKYSKQRKTYGIDGLKTGHVARSGYCLITTCKPKGRDRLIVVIMNDAKRYEDTLSVIKATYKANKLK